ncbi:MAG: diversity-generating retroelement protein Avd [Planctomycetes bacterium]|nr:diversity-generating retroelement protein Avd [Planctomycetota bacterium]
MRTYELLKWYLGRIEKFPRSHRYGLGQRIETTLYAVFEGLVRASYTSGTVKAAELAEANLKLEILRMHGRLAHELTVLPHKSYEYASRELDEIGRMVGGWLKQQRTSRSSSA